MEMMRRYILAFLTPLMLAAAPIDYKVHFLGLDDKSALETVKDATFLTTLKKKKPISINALRFRAESDIPDILKALHSHGYYDALAQIQIVEEGDEVDVFVMIEPGPIYTIGSFEVTVTTQGSPQPSLSLDALGIQLGAPANAVKIIDAELQSLTLLSECGYPLAHVLDRQIVADYKTKKVAVHLSIEAGPLTYFGDTTIYGSPRIKQKLFENKMAWKAGELYDTRQVEATQKKLLDTGLFSSVIISHDETPTSEKQLPMRIEATETKHKSVNIGASYQTEFGPG